MFADNDIYENFFLYQYAHIEELDKGISHLLENDEYDFPFELTEDDINYIKERIGYDS